LNDAVVAKKALNNAAERLIGAKDVFHEYGSGNFCLNGFII